jgi:hypothetical protein
MGAIEMSVPGSVGSGQAEAHLGAEQRRLAGRAARTTTPRRAHAEYTPRAGRAGERRYANQVERVVLGQQLMPSVSDILLGRHRGEGLDGVTRDFYVRQLADWKGGAAIESLRPDWQLWYGQNAGDYHRLADAVATGHISAEPGS